MLRFFVLSFLFVAHVSAGEPTPFFNDGFLKSGAEETMRHTPRAHISDLFDTPFNKTNVVRINLVNGNTYNVVFDAPVTSQMVHDITRRGLFVFGYIQKDGILYIKPDSIATILVKDPLTE